MLKPLLIVIFIFSYSSFSFAQKNTVLAHSHNDYKNEIPFWMAYYNHFGSIEADVWERDGRLYVAHEQNEILSGRTLDSLYLAPIVKTFRSNNGKAWTGNDETYQLMIELKSSTEPSLSILCKKLKQYPDVFDFTNHPNAVRVVITGNRPMPADFSKYPAYILFDGQCSEKYTIEQRKRIGLFSNDLSSYTSWNGKGSIPVNEKQHLKDVIDSVHAIHNKIRFWNAPDNINAWKSLINLGVDFINTDHISQMAAYLAKRDKCQYTAFEKHEAYVPTYEYDNSKRKVKNVILLIGDGMGVSQLYAGYTANGGVLSIFNMHSIGFSKTSSADSYNTDSAAGGTALSTGQKTYNRTIGCDTTMQPLPNIPEIIFKYGILSGIVSVGDITDATPAVFYAHQSERSLSEKIALDFLNSPAEVLMGGNQSAFTHRADGRDLLSELKNKGFQIYTDINKTDGLKKGKAIVLDDREVRSKIDGRGDFLPIATRKSIEVLSASKKGFFMMAEGAQIDWGGHFNNMQYVVREMLDFDKAVAEALRFADKNGETLVLVTADHECGGLSLLDGNYKTGMIDGQFSSIDHTGIMVPVFAYGPHSSDFCGVYENVEVFNKIINLLK
jgi:alkaline phosphatase